MPATDDLPSPAPAPPSLLRRLRVAAGLFARLRKPDFQAAGTFVSKHYGDRSFPARWCLFLGWALRQMFVAIPEGMQCLTIAKHVSRTPMWLLDANPLANHPWSVDPQAGLPGKADTVVIGAGFTGGALAYHWSKRAPADRLLVVLEMDDASSGASGRNEGLVVMGRYYKMVQRTVLGALPVLRPDLDAADRARLADQFAAVYCRAAYRNADMIEQTINAEGFDCDYARAGWVQSRDAHEQQALDASVQLAQDSGFPDWTKISPDETFERSGMRVSHHAAFSRGAASWHPARWVWCLFRSALAVPCVQLFTRTKVTGVDDAGDHYVVQTARGAVRARHVVYATESYTPTLDPAFHDAILPMQEQGASGEGGPVSMRPHVGISGAWFFAGRYGSRVLFGSGGSRVRDHEAGRNRPSRFLTKFVATELRRTFEPYALHMTHEWSGTVGYTPDEYPVVGCIDGRGRWVIGGMCGSGSGVAFNAGRCIVNRILGHGGEEDDYPEAYFAPGRLLDPAAHAWPAVEDDGKAG